VNAGICFGHEEPGEDGQRLVAYPWPVRCFVSCYLSQ